MPPSIQMSIPQPFSWLLPGQGLIAGVIIYSTIYVFGVGTIPFILSVVAAGLHFILGLYFCFTKNRLRTHDVYMVPLWLVACAGVWTGSLYYFAKRLDIIIRLGRYTAGTTGQPEIPTWTKVGTALNGLNVLIDFVLIAIFIRAAVRSSKAGAVTNSPYPAVAPIYQPYQPPQQQQQYQPQPQYYQVPVVQQQHPVPQRIISTTSSDFKAPVPSTISPATSPSPSQQYQQPLQPQQHAYFAYQQPSPPQVQPSPESPNRIDILRRLCALQSPSGSWAYTPELVTLLHPWTTQQIPNNPYEVTALAHSIMQDICNYIWAAQRERREQSALSPAELASLQGLGVGGDLSWAGMALDRAGGWLRGQGMGVGQNQGGYR